MEGVTVSDSVDAASAHRTMPTPLDPERLVQWRERKREERIFPNSMGIKPAL